MLDQNTINNQAKLREEISRIKQYLSLIEHEVNSSDHVERLSDDDVQIICRKLQIACNWVYNADYLWASCAGDNEFSKKLAERTYSSQKIIKEDNKE